MQKKTGQKETTEEAAARTGEDPEERKRQQQTDPNITELKGLIDPDEYLEPKDTDNEFNKDS
jgi:hypothetical protein